MQKRAVFTCGTERALVAGRNASIIQNRADTNVINMSVSMFKTERALLVRVGDFFTQKAGGFYLWDWAGSNIINVLISIFTSGRALVVG